MLSREAAVNLRKIWQAHDERNFEMGAIAAEKLYLILGADEDNAKIAGPHVIRAFFHADEAEEYQNTNPEMEDKWYEKAKEELVLARQIVGFETKSPEYTIKWWKGYRHKNEKEIVDGLVNEHRTQFRFINPIKRDEYAKLCTKKLIEAARKGHDVKDWGVVDDFLVEYFDLYFAAIKNSR